jgi:hypothetical protein
MTIAMPTMGLNSCECLFCKDRIVAHHLRIQIHDTISTFLELFLLLYAQYYTFE